VAEERVAPPSSLPSMRRSTLLGSFSISSFTAQHHVMGSRICMPPVGLDGRSGHKVERVG
jgi:hypothetical protein